METSALPEKAVAVEATKAGGGRARGQAWGVAAGVARAPPVALGGMGEEPGGRRVLGDFKEPQTHLRGPCGPPVTDSKASWIRQDARVYTDGLEPLDLGQESPSTRPSREPPLKA